MPWVLLFSLLPLTGVATFESYGQTVERARLDGEPEALEAVEARREVPRDPSVDMEFVFVKGGCFPMGDTFGDGWDDEGPVHRVCVSDFFMGKYEVTQGQWKAAMGTNPSRFSSCGDSCPVENVSWDDIQEFIRRLNGATGQRYRLPTEAEWEYAARSGGRSEKYAGTSSDDDLPFSAWYSANSGGTTHPVGQKRPNGLGLHDMSGNVWEWCQDWYGKDYYAESPQDDPAGPPSGRGRVGRGGSWFDYPRGVRASSRLAGLPSTGSDILGFRLVRTR